MNEQPTVEQIAANILGPCCCEEPYKTRGRIDPRCLMCELGEDFAEALKAERDRADELQLTLWAEQWDSRGAAPGWSRESRLDRWMEDVGVGNRRVAKIGGRWMLSGDDTEYPTARAAMLAAKTKERS